jgi:hypothetical protein
MRGHYSAPIQSIAGDLQGGATVSVFARGTTQGGTQLGTLTTLPVYADATTGNLMTNPFIVVTGQISFYLPFATRVDLGVQVPGQAQVFFPDVDVPVAGMVPTVVTSGYTVLLSDQLVLASAAAGAVVLTLPALTAGFAVRIKRTDSSGNAMTMAPPAGAQIDGSATPVVLTALAKTFVYCDGTAYWTV